MRARPVDASSAWVPPELPAAHGWSGGAAAPRWVGLVPYEATRGIERTGWTRTPDERPVPAIARPTWFRYDAVVRVDHASGRVVIEADDEHAAARVSRLGSLVLDVPELGFDVRALPPLEPDERHADRIREVLTRIAKRGDVYQVNLARAIDLELRAGDPLDVFLALYRASPAPYGFFADFGSACVCAASPELALEVSGETIRTTPIKGTRPRGEDAGADRDLAHALDADAKERAELTMAIDLHRNDLGRVARVGSVRVLGEPRVVGGKTVWSRASEVVARRAEGASLDAIARAVLPCGSVTGAPKVRAMEIIAQLEPLRRGAYTGAFGYVSRGNDLVLAMAIRTLEIGAPEPGTSSRHARYGTGGGIVKPTADPVREVDETRWKPCARKFLAALFSSVA